MPCIRTVYDILEVKDDNEVKYVNDKKVLMIVTVRQGILPFISLCFLTYFPS